MKYKLKKLRHLSGHRASIYSIFLFDEKSTLYERFLKENFNLYLSEIKDINNRLRIIGKHTGAQEGFFKKWEGNLGDGVEALYDRPNARLRLYCIRYSSGIVIVGGGGPKNVRALQDNKKLKQENYLLRDISSQITERIREGRIQYSEDLLDFLGDLEFKGESDE